MEESEAADALFFHTLKAAAVAGLYQVFLEGGSASGMLLRRAYVRAAAPASTDRDVLSFVGSLLSRWDARNAGSPPKRPGGRVNDTLTARERDVLAMIGQGFANKRIARILEISPETVKSHVRRIFSKLAVSARRGGVWHRRSPWVAVRFWRDGRAAAGSLPNRATASDRRYLEPCRRPTSQDYGDSAVINSV